MATLDPVTAERRFREPGYVPTAERFVRHVADRWGDRDLVLMGERRLTYRDLEVESRRLARALLASGVSRGSRVGLLAPNGPEWVVAWLAAARIGAVVVLLNTFHKARELGWALAHCEAEVLLTVDRYLSHDYAARLEEAVDGLGGQRHDAIDCDSHPSLRAVWIWSEAAATPSWAGSMDDLLARSDEVPDERFDAATAEVEPHDPMVVIYTSGSTSAPKGVVHSQASVIIHPFNLLQFRDLREGDVLYTPMPLFWVGGLSYVLVSAMHTGAAVVFEERFEPGSTLDLIERRRVTHVIGWPHIAKALVEHPSFGVRDLSSIRGGSFDDLLPVHLRVSDRRRKATSLGMTESLGPHSIEALHVELPEGKEDSFGRSVPGIEHRIVDPETGDELPAGQAGEIWIRGYSLMLGLLGQDPADVFEPGGWYRTGDRGLLDPDGHLYFQGRLGTVIKAGGTNVAPREVELAIESQPGVMHAFVVGVPAADSRGEAVAAAVVAKPGSEIDPADLQVRLRGEMASYKVPRHVAVFAEQQDLPWLESGKIDLQALRRLLIDRFANEPV
ncbi:MAG: class I adenylate-forming enzyme family protein [Acidimicrobiaceae bacterium]|nr:class I adenylate-forming enzyme family protein [Acidimicrobiaceae bacterium]MDE0517547.1 class I adenylate-forming enzyme family protein [Acidimicrobiaceae bacterium]MDE0656063.1 class I adenylate-forming enzyme family protein [Acidimicrobiaceae bacterium]